MRPKVQLLVALSLLASSCATSRGGELRCDNQSGASIHTFGAGGLARALEKAAGEGFSASDCRFTPLGQRPAWREHQNSTNR